MKVDEERISFRRLAETDFPLMHRWLNSPEVARWVDLGGRRYPDWETVVGKLTPRTDGAEAVRSYVIHYDEKPIGYIQSALNDDHPAYKEAFEVEDGTAGVDVFIGEEDYLHKGLGSFIIGKFLREVVFVVYDVNVCMIDPEPENTIAIRAYEKAGFRHTKTVWNPAGTMGAYLMTISR